MTAINTILTIATFQAIVLYFMRNNRTIIFQLVFTFVIVVLYFTLFPKLFVAFFVDGLEGCAFAGFSTYFAFSFTGMFATLFVFLIYLLIRNKVSADRIIEEEEN